MQTRPKIKLNLTVTDRAVEIIALLAVFAIWILVIMNYSSLPDIIAIHYDSAGQVDRFGSKLNIWILPVIATILYFGLTALNKFPHIFNYPATITHENARKQYSNATAMVRYLKFIILFIFVMIEYKIIQQATGQIKELGEWFLPVTLILLLSVITYFTIKSFSMKY